MSIALVSVVHDDVSVREALPDLLEQLGFATRVFASAENFLASNVVGSTQCLILDIVMPGHLEFFWRDLDARNVTSTDTLTLDFEMANEVHAQAVVPA